MSVGQLRERYAQAFGEQTRTRHRAYLIRKIAWRLQATAEGDLSERARRRAAELAKDTELRVGPPKSMDQPPHAGDRVEPATTTDRRLPAIGTSFVRHYKGRAHEVHVQPDGFEYAGERFKSLTGVAKRITGSHCNGFRFFKLEAAQ
jgi:hypothetical protein